MRRSGSLAVRAAAAAERAGEGSLFWCRSQRAASPACCHRLGSSAPVSHSSLPMAAPTELQDFRQLLQRAQACDPSVGGVAAELEAAVEESLTPDGPSELTLTVREGPRDCAAAADRRRPPADAVREVNQCSVCGASRATDGGLLKEVPRLPACQVRRPLTGCAWAASRCSRYLLQPGACHALCVPAAPPLQVLRNGLPAPGLGGAQGGVPGGARRRARAARLRRERSGHGLCWQARQRLCLCRPHRGSTIRCLRMLFALMFDV